MMGMDIYEHMRNRGPVTQAAFVAEEGRRALRVSQYLNPRYGWLVANHAAAMWGVHDRALSQIPGPLAEV